MSFNGSCPGWELILEIECGTEPRSEYVREGLEKVRGRRAMEGRTRKAKPLNEPPAYPGVSKPQHWGRQVS